MIVLDNICKAYEDKEVLVNTSFHIKKGEFIAIFGVSGCGKSTLLNILGMLEDKDAGQYQFMGRQAPDSHSKHAQRIRRHHIGYLFQNYALIDEETVEENLKYAQKYSKKSLKMKKAEIGVCETPQPALLQDFFLHKKI
jgi:putative ABC transport system ATP-binding protein